VIAAAPFMITAAMRAALKHRGHSDSDISAMTPAEAHEILMRPHDREIRSFLEAFVALAIASLAGHPAPGLLPTCHKQPDGALIPVRYEIADADVVDRITRDATAASDGGFNVYVEGRFVKRGLRGKKRGEFEDTVCVFALVVDSDADKGMAWTPPTGQMPPTLAVETSPNNRQYWYFFEKALRPESARQLGEGLRLATGCDSDTGNPVQPYRIPGTVNYPDRVKVARGRVVTPTLFLRGAIT
jgi:hypothetical protein